MALRKNRKKRNSAFIFPLPVAAVLLVTVVLLLMYVWLDARGEALGVRIKRLEQEQSEIRKHYSAELWKWEKMKSPSNIEYQLSRNNVVMILADEDSLVRLHEPTAFTESTPDSEGAVAQLASHARFIIND